MLIFFVETYSLAISSSLILNQKLKTINIVHEKKTIIIDSMTVLLRTTYY